LISKIESVESKYSVDYVAEVEKLKEKEAEYDAYLESQVDSYIDDQRESDEPRGLSDQEETEVIRKL